MAGRKMIDKNNGGSGVEFSATVAKAAQVPNVHTIINGHNPTTTTPAAGAPSRYSSRGDAAVSRATRSATPVTHSVATT